MRNHVPTKPMLFGVTSLRSLYRPPSAMVTCSHWMYRLVPIKCLWKPSARWVAICFPHSVQLALVFTVRLPQRFTWTALASCSPSRVFPHVGQVMGAETAGCGDVSEPLRSWRAAPVLPLSAGDDGPLCVFAILWLGMEPNIVGEPARPASAH